MTINCKGLIDLSTLNNGNFECDSQFVFDGGRYNDESELLTQVGKMISDGATFMILGLILVNLVQNSFQKRKELSRRIIRFD
jgi:dihydropteroate synthase